MSTETAIDLDEARIRLEGRVEIVEAATAQWQALQAGFCGGEMRVAPTPSSVSEQREALSALTRYPACKPIIERFTLAQQQAVAAVEHRLARLRLENKGPISLRDELEQHLPVSSYSRWRLFAPSMPHLLGALVRVLWWAGAATLVVGLMAFSGGPPIARMVASAIAVVVAVVADSRYLTPHQLLVTQKAVLTDRFAYFSDIVSVTSMRLARPRRPQQTQLSFEFRDGTTCVLVTPNGPEALFATLRRHGVECHEFP